MRTLCNINVGIKPYQVGKGSPRQTRSVVTNRPFDAPKKINSLYRAYLRGSDILRYRMNPLEPRFLKYGPWLAEPRPSANFDAPIKLLMRQTGDSIVATVDEEQHLCLNNMHVLVPMGEAPSVYYILGVLNSRLMNWYYQTLNPEVGEALAEVKKTNVEVFPILIPQGDRERELVAQVDSLLRLNREFLRARTEHDRTQTQRQIDGVEHQIDAAVYELYDLTVNEVAIIEGRVALASA